ncbi:MAG: reverse transcriptase/maturase family protein [Candidatus Vecturithrix sp.]|jgi:group II intron reverse transcriptase/maturase|nr:reverse transcriptase/maturase family protein [Candidatus Vecturithrix sp.]
MPPNDAQKYLEIVRKRGERKAELKHVYENIRRRKELFLIAYQHLYANKGVLTPGIHPEDTIDGMSLKRIDAIVGKLKNKTYTWTPVRRTYIEKNNSKNLRPLGIPGWTDKLLEEVIRMVLEAYFEPQFRQSSHGFRPQRGCHTALKEISVIGKGSGWFIEGDIKGCFDNISHTLIIHILKRTIKDKDFLQLIWGMLKAGYWENWRYYATYSGTPQGGVVSPLLANIVLNELDCYIEDIVIPKYTQGKKRRLHREYNRLRRQAKREREKGNWDTANDLRRQYTKMPSVDSKDPNYRRLWYVRYADDFILGYAGTKEEAESIKDEIREFLQNALLLEMSEEKTLITNAFTGKARFLNYEMNRSRAHNRIKTVGNHRRRTANAILWFSIPHDVVRRWKAKVTKGNKVIHRKNLMEVSDYDIITTYEVELQGLINYYAIAHNHRQESLLKTLAAKHQVSKPAAERKYRRFVTIDRRRIVGIEIEREHKKPLVATFGKKPLKRECNVKIQDTIQTIHINRNELITRLLTDVCELCGSTENVEGHHIRKLSDLKKQYTGKSDIPKWVQKMIAIRRKTLFVCHRCHRKIHNGLYDGAKLANISLESLIQ